MLVLLVAVLVVGDAGCGRGARGAVLAFRRDRVRAFADVFFVTLGIVSSSDWGISSAESRSVILAWPLRAFLSTVYAARGPYTTLKISAGSRRCKPEVDTNEW